MLIPFLDSQEEIEDLKLHYLEFKGDMAKIYERAFCMAAEEDRDRIRSILQKLIDDEEVEHFAKFDQVETAAQKKRRQRKVSNLYVTSFFINTNAFLF
jgi:hypothetical protein